MNTTQDTLAALRESRDMMREQLESDPGNASLWARYIDVLNDIEDREAAADGNSGNGLASLISSLRK